MSKRIPKSVLPYMPGIRAAGDGLKLALRNKEVGRAYLRAAAVIFALSLVIDVAAIWALFRFTTPADDAAIWLIVLIWVGRVAGTVGTLLVAPLLAIFTINIAFPFFNKPVFLAGLQAVDPERAAALAAKPGMPLAPAIGIAARRLVTYFLLSAIVFVFGFVPVVGLVAPLVQLGLTARTVAWELMDPYFDCLDIRYAEQKAIVARLHKPLFGFGFPVALLLAIPFVGPLGFGLAQAAAATFVAREFPIDPREASQST